LLAAGAPSMTTVSMMEGQGSGEAGAIATGGHQGGQVTAHGPLSPGIGAPSGWSVGLDSEGTTTTVLP
jgi:hypothetical protein